MDDSKEYPFESHAWDEDPDNNNRWCDAAQVERAYKLLLDRNTELEKITKDVFRLDSCKFETAKDAAAALFMSFGQTVVNLMNKGEES
jgi:hypothetical protein